MSQLYLHDLVFLIPLAPVGLIRMGSVPVTAAKPTLT